MASMSPLINIRRRRPQRHGRVLHSRAHSFNGEQYGRIAGFIAVYMMLFKIMNAFITALNPQCTGLQQYCTVSIFPEQKYIEVG